MCIWQDVLFLMFLFFMAFDGLRFDKENEKGVFSGYFLWLVIGYGVGKFFST